MVQLTHAAYSEGIETFERGVVKQRGYCAAKTAADSCKQRNKVGLDEALEAPKNVSARRKASADDLWFYAKLIPMANLMWPYMEAVA